MHSALNEKSIFDLVNVTMNVTNTAPSKTIVDAIGQSFGVTVTLVFGSTSPVGISFYRDSAEVHLK